MSTTKHWLAVFTLALLPVAVCGLAQTGGQPANIKGTFWTLHVRLQRT
jgi:hypothetical protein